MTRSLKNQRACFASPPPPATYASMPNLKQGVGGKTEGGGEHRAFPGVDRPHRRPTRRRRRRNKARSCFVSVLCSCVPLFVFFFVFLCVCDRHGSAHRLCDHGQVVPCLFASTVSTTEPFRRNTGPLRQKSCPVSGVQALLPIINFSDGGKTTLAQESCAGQRRRLCPHV